MVENNGSQFVHFWIQNVLRFCGEGLYPFVIKRSVALIPELSEIVKPELSHLLSELRNRSISEVLELFQWNSELYESSWVGLGYVSLG